METLFCSILTKLTLIFNLTLGLAYLLGFSAFLPPDKLASSVAVYVLLIVLCII